MRPRRWRQTNPAGEVVGEVDRPDKTCLVQGRPPARTSATRWEALTDRHRVCGFDQLVGHRRVDGARPTPLVILVRKRTAAWHPGPIKIR